MKSKLVLLAIMLCGIFGEGSLQAQVSYQISGTWKNGQGNKVYLKDFITADSLVAIDSATVNNDRFVLKGNVAEIRRMEFVCKEGRKKIFIDGEPIMIDIVEKADSARNKTWRDVIVTGNLEQYVLGKSTELTYMSAMMQLGEMMSLSNAIKNTKDSVVMRHQVDSIQHVFGQIKEAIDKNISALADTARNSYAITYFIDEYIGKYKPFDVFKQYYDNLTDRVKSSVCGKALKEKVDAMAKANVGGIAPNIELPTPDGKALSLYSLRGRIVLLDFWASWCGPCLREMPNVKAIYNKYHEKGLEILGVSLDKTKEAWTNAIEKHDLPWKHISSLKGWDCPVAKLFNITGIPRMYILDENGKIIAQDLRGDALAQKMDELFQNK